MAPSFEETVSAVLSQQSHCSAHNRHRDSETSLAKGAILNGRHGF